MPSAFKKRRREKLEAKLEDASAVSLAREAPLHSRYENDR